MYLPLIAIFIALSGSMGVSYMAKNSLPGDSFYPIKVRINDEVHRLTGTQTEKLNALPDATSSDTLYLNNNSADEDNSSATSDDSLYIVNQGTSTATDTNQVINAE